MAKGLTAAERTERGGQGNLTPSPGNEDPVPATEGTAADGALAVSRRLSKAEKRQAKFERKKQKAREAHQRNRKRRREAANEAWSKLNDEEQEKRRESTRRLIQRSRARLEAAFESGVRVAVDLSYTNREQETRSLARQLVYAYSVLKRGEGNISLHLLSYAGTVAQALDKVGGQSWMVHRHTAPLEEVFGGRRLCYLTPDASKELTELSEDCTYVVGGIVDRTPTKGLTIQRAEGLQVDTARLPIQSSGLPVRPNLILNVDHVIAALAGFQEHGDWGQALRAVIPRRFVRDI